VCGFLASESIDHDGIRTGAAVRTVRDDVDVEC
jgi:hypothetical protein